MAEPAKKTAFERRRKGRNLALAGGLIVFILLIYGITIVRQSDFPDKKPPTVSGAAK